MAEKFVKLNESTRIKLNKAKGLILTKEPKIKGLYDDDVISYVLDYFLGGLKNGTRKKKS